MVGRVMKVFLVLCVFGAVLHETTGDHKRASRVKRQLLNTLINPVSLCSVATFSLNPTFQLICPNATVPAINPVNTLNSPCLFRSIRLRYPQLCLGITASLPQICLISTYRFLPQCREVANFCRLPGAANNFPLICSTGQQAQTQPQTQPHNFGLPNFQTQPNNFGLPNFNPYNTFNPANAIVVANSSVVRSVFPNGTFTAFQPATFQQAVAKALGLPVGLTPGGTVPGPIALGHIPVFAGKK